MSQAHVWLGTGVEHVDGREEGGVDSDFQSYTLAV